MRTSLLLLAVGALMALPARAQETDCLAEHPTTAGPIPAQLLTDCAPPQGFPVPNAGPTDEAAGIHNNGAGAARVVTFVQNTPGTLVEVAAQVNPSATAFINAADFAGDDFSKLYFLSSENHWRTVDMATGEVTNLPNATAPTGAETYTGMAWDYTTETMYVVSAATGAATLGTIDLTTGVVTTVAPIAPANLIIDIAIHPITGEIYAIDIGDDNTIKIDRTTGAATVIGPIGFNANFGQGMDFDNDDLTLYHYAVNTTGGNSTGLYSVDLVTGASTLIAPLGTVLTQMGDGASMTSPGGGPGPIVFTSTDTPLVIPDDDTGGVNSVITVVPSGSLMIDDLDVGFVATHSWTGDLIATVSHGATSVTFMDQPGTPPGTFGCSGNNPNIVADDEGTDGSIESSCVNETDSPAYPVSGGHYTPNNPLSVFDGVDAAGTWTLNVSDNAGGDTGQLDSWSLLITPAAGGPTVNTYTETPNVPLPDNTPAGLTSTITVPSSPNIVLDVDVQLTTTHSWAGDIIANVAHGAVSSTVYDRPGFPTTTFGCSGDNPTLTIDDEGTGGAVEDSCTNTAVAFPPGVNYTPNNPLDVFDNMDVEGDWVLTISDNAQGDTGSLNSWSIIVTEDIGTAGAGSPDATVATLRAMPNPMSASGTLELSVPTSQHVRVAVYDMLGREVMVVFDRELAASQRALIGIGAERLQAGAYVVRATGSDFVATQRITVTR